MGCCTSKAKLNPALSKSEYRLNALGDLWPLKTTPCQLEAETAGDDFVSTRLFHNLFYSGFYAPFICNSSYMLIVDCRAEYEYNASHVLTSLWRRHLAEQIGHDSYTHVVLYDDQSQDWAGASEKLVATFEGLKSKGVRPVCVKGGFLHINADFPYMVKSKLSESQLIVHCDQSAPGSGPARRHLAVQWYPSIIDDLVLVGRADQAASPDVIFNMRVTHVLSVVSSGRVGRVVFQHLAYLSVNLDEPSAKQPPEEQQLLQELPRIMEFITTAATSGGRVLIHCDQGVNRAAIICLAYLMQRRLCTLEDAYSYLSSLRPCIQPSHALLRQLTALEQVLFGRKLSNVEDLEF